MEPTLFYVGLYFLVSLLHIASSRVDSYNGWKNSPNVQYHIQTDEGEERYFKYQTKSGQYRKEKRLQDGTVVGTYGWVDPNGYLRLRDYIADNQGYRILKTKMIYVGGNSVPGESTPGSFHTKYSPLPSVTFQLPFENQPHRFNTYVPPSPYSPTTTTENSYVPPYVAQQSYQTPTTTNAPPTTQLPSSTPTTPVVSYPPFYASSSTPFVEVSPNSIPRTSTAGYSSTTASPSVAIFNDPTPKPIAVYSTTPKPVAVNYVSTPAPTASTNEPISYSTTPLPIEQTKPVAIAAIGYTSSTPPPAGPPVSGKFAYFDNGNNNFFTETEKNKLFFQNEAKNNYYGNRDYVPDYSNRVYNFDYNNRGYNFDYNNRGYNFDYTNNNFPEYDGIATVQNGFRYYLPRHYHEEESSSSGQERAGSFGYIDPFGIRRVIYYNTSPGRGFVHRKNNRYVGFNATPYDPRPNF